MANTKPAEQAEEKTVRIKIPKLRNDESDVFVSINERTWQIQRGIYVEVPECVAVLLENNEMQMDSAAEFDKASQNQSAKRTKELMFG